MILQIEPGHRIVHCEEGESLLDVLLREGVAISYSCKIGNCGMCEVEPFELFETERHQRAPLMPRKKGFLACQRNVVKELGIRLPAVRPAANVPFQYHQGRIVSLEEIAPAVFRLDIDTGKKPARFFPGQKFVMSLSRGHSPLLVPVNSPGACRLSFLIDGGSQGPLVEELRERGSNSQEINLVGPIGNAYFLPDDDAPAVVCALGMGVVAARSIVETLVVGKHSRSVKLLLEPSLATSHLIDEICSLCSTHLPESEVVSHAASKRGPDSQSGQRFAAMPAASMTGMVDFIQINHQRIQAEQAYVFAPSCALMAIKMSLIGAGINGSAVFMENADLNFVEEENIDVSLKSESWSGSQYPPEILSENRSS